MEPNNTDRLANTLQHATGALTTTGERTKTAIAETAQHIFEAGKAKSNQAITSVDSVFNQGKDGIINRFRTGKDGIEQAMQGTNTWVNATLDRAQTPFTQPFQGFQSWLEAHAYIGWAIAHPLLALGVLLLAIVLFFVLLKGFLSAIARLTEQAWFALLQSPFRLVQWLSSLVLGTFNRSIPPKQAALMPQAQPITTKQERLTHVLKKLEAMRQEQDELLREVKAILAVEE